jgi:starch synthase
MPSRYEPCGLSQIMALKYGTIPVVRETGGLADTIIDNQDGNGNGFTFKDYNYKALISAIERAISEYNNPDSWNALIKRAMDCDFSWDTGSADKYIALYNAL